MTWLALSMILVGLLIGLPLTAMLVRLGQRLGALDSAGSEGHEKLTLRNVPNIGGIAIAAAVVIPLGVAALVIGLLGDDTLARLVPAIEPHLPRLRDTLPSLVALLGGVIVLHVMGLVDDRRGLPAVPKLLVQIAIAAMLAIWFDVRLLELLGPVPSIIVTVVWIVAVTNAINFLDNMDGLAAGVSAIAAALLMAACIVNAQWFIAATLALLIGGLIGFLVFNLPPARIFMGDGGSLVVGFLLAVLTARTTYLHPDLGGSWYGVFMPVIILAIPLYDLTSVTLIRIAQGRSPLVGDQQHFSHRLVLRGMSKRGAVLTISGATAVTGIGGVSLGRLEGWQAALVVTQTLLVLAWLAAMEHASRHAVSRGQPPERPSSVQ